MIEITDSGPCHMSKHNLASSKQQWEFLKPVVAVPAGWVEIHNHATGHVLSQKYVTSPPKLVPLSTYRTGWPLPRHRETWAAQWTLALPSAYILEGEGGNSAWVIKNRLTEARLRFASHPYNDKHSLSVVSVINRSTAFVKRTEMWEIEFEDDNLWKIRSRHGSKYLEQTDVCIGSGKELACTSDRVESRDHSKMWSFK